MRGKLVTVGRTLGAVFLLGGFLPSVCRSDEASESGGNALRFPPVIRFPEHLAACEEYVHPKTGERIVIFPVALYLHAYYDGWQECLFRFHKLNIDLKYEELGPYGFATFEPYTRRGVQDGFESCRNLILTLLAKGSKNSVLALAAESYKPRNVVSWNFSRFAAKKLEDGNGSGPESGDKSNLGDDKGG